MTTFCISDLHLSAQRPAITELFLDLLRREGPHADAFYILGDLFEYWIGDEAASHGNRDFLLGAQFERETGCRLIQDPIIVDLYGTSVLLMHGDTLCTDDHEYQAIRQRVRSSEWIEAFLRKSIGERNAIVRQFRERSKIVSATKPPEIMDVNQQAVEATLRKHGVRHLIHGHTHRPGQHVFDLDGERAHRDVLGDWYKQGSVLRCDAQEWLLQDIPLSRLNGPRSAIPAE
jgi:UDP-2,3-diacylglucosamine hydrolase